MHEQHEPRQGIEFELSTSSHPERWTLAIEAPSRGVLLQLVRNAERMLSQNETEATIGALSYSVSETAVPPNET